MPKKFLIFVARTKIFAANIFKICGRNSENIWHKNDFFLHNQKFLRVYDASFFPFKWEHGEKSIIRKFLLLSSLLITKNLKKFIKVHLFIMNHYEFFQIFACNSKIILRPSITQLFKRTFMLFYFIFIFFLVIDIFRKIQKNSENLLIIYWEITINFFKIFGRCLLSKKNVTFLQTLNVIYLSAIKNKKLT